MKDPYTDPDYAHLSRDQRIRLALARAHNITAGMPWWYLSFADEGQFLGACLVQAPDALAAPARAHVLGINPGGQCMILEVTEIDKSPFTPEHRNRLLSKEELVNKFGGKTIGELEDRS